MDSEEGLNSCHDKPQVLLAENNLIFAMSLISQLKSFGVNCDLAYEPEEALEKVREKYESQSSSYYKLVLISQSLETFGDGFDICKQISSLYKGESDIEARDYSICLLSN